MIYFIDCFAIHPSENMVLHTLPFTILILSVSIVALRVIYYETHIKWAGEFEAWQMAGARVYLALLFLFSIAKIFFQMQGMFKSKYKDPQHPELGFTPGVTHPGAARFADLFWMVLAILIPLAKSIQFGFVHGDSSGLEVTPVLKRTHAFHQEKTISLLP